jgi:glycosyltransferase involved in cell wall biosynthesis
VALSDNIKKCFTDRGVNESTVSVLPNGVDTELYNFKESNLLHADKSIYLAKIEPRKRQILVQGKGLNIHFAGKIADPEFVQRADEYIGELPKKEIYKSLTEYANMILLSKAEAHSVVCIEALAAGLGLVISEHCTANLDLSKPFISVIKEEKLTDVDYIKSAIEENRQTSLSMRAEIRAYGKKSFGWDNILRRYEEIIESV